MIWQNHESDYGPPGETCGWSDKWRWGSAGKTGMIRSYLLAISFATIDNVPSGERDDSMLSTSTPIGITIRPSNLSKKNTSQMFLNQKAPLFIILVQNFTARCLWAEFENKM